MNFSVTKGTNLFQGGTLKSTQDKVARQQKTAAQVEFWEQQKANLRKTDSGSLDEIRQKLDMLHNYNDAISAAKASYNQEQAFHALDEAREWGEKVHEQVEKMAPKTKEERKKDLLKELTGDESGEGMLTELLDSLDQTERIEEQIEEAKEAEEALKEAEAAKQASEELMKSPEARLAEEAVDLKKAYAPLDIRV